MKSTGSMILAVLLLCAGTTAAQQAQTDLPLVVTNGPASRTLFFGLAPAATDGQDLAMGEFEVPPPPPAGAFDVRFAALDDGSDLQGQWKDYRKGERTSAGTSLYRLRFQAGEGTDAIVFTWNLPAGVSGRLVDRMGGLVVDRPMNGTGNYTLTRLALTELEMQIFWNGGDGLKESSTPERFALEQNYPNPFNPSTTIRYALPAAGPVHLRIFDVTGREVATLDAGIRQAGRYEVVWDATGVAGGVYFCRLTASGFTETRSLVLLK
jgi:hypothetical protein